MVAQNTTAAVLKNVTEELWAVKDEYHDVKCLAIPGMDKDTGWGMVYKGDRDGNYTPTRPVSTQYEPVSTGAVITAMRDRFGDMLVDEDVNIRLSKQAQSTSHVVSLRINKPFEIDIPLKDQGKFTRFGETDIKTDLWFPTLRAANAYDGTRSFLLGFGFEREVCKNGMRAMVPGSGFSTGKVIHFSKSIQEALNKFENFEFDTNIEMVQDAMKKLGGKKLNAATKKAMEKALPKKYIKEFTDEYADKTMYGAMNYLTYLSTHVYDEHRTFQLAPVLRGIMKAAA